jgi:hypothetical protein
MTRPPHIRVVTGDFTGQATRVLFVDRDGAETDISHSVRALNVDLRVDRLNSVTLECAAGDGSDLRAAIASVAAAEPTERETVLRQLERVATMQLKPDDRVVLTVKESSLGAGEARLLEETAKNIFPDNDVIVIAGDVDLTVVSPTAEAAA